MSTPTDRNQNQTPEQIQADIEAQREQLADTVDQLTAKLDVKSQARQKAAELKNRATTESGNPRPEVIVAAGSLAAMAVALLWWRRRNR